MGNSLRVSSLVLTFALVTSGCRKTDTSANRAPSTAKRPVTDTYHDVNVVDDYRWLEDWNNPEVRQWSDSQNTLARTVLNRLESRDDIRTRVTAIRTFKSKSYRSLLWRSGKLFAIEEEPPKQQPFLVVMDSPEDASKARTIVDPNAIDSSGSTTIDFYEPSFDGRLVAVSLSKAGSENGDVHVYETSTGKEVYEVVPRVQGGTAGGDLAWTTDSTGFYYTRYPHEGERAKEDLAFYQQLYFHKLGTPIREDRYETGKDLPKIAEIRVESHPSRNYLIAAVQHGDGGGVEHYLRDPKGVWTRVNAIADRVVGMTFGSKDDLYFVSHKDAARGKLLQLSLANPQLDKAKTVVPESGESIEVDFWQMRPSPLITSSRIYVPYQTGGPMTIRAFDLDGHAQTAPDLLPISAVYSMRSIQDDLLFLNVSFTKPAAWHRFSPKGKKTTPTSLVSISPVDLSDAEVVQDSAVSRDGTRVPFMLIRRKGSEGKPMPTIAAGYGGYGISSMPYFNPLLRLMLDNDVAFVQTVIRGGGEFGEEWHEQGRLTKKQNVFDDFAAVLKHLVDRGYTSQEKLAIIGGSNGGLLMGATFTQHPQLMRAVVSYVGMYDMLRDELSPNGFFNVPEFGTVKDKDLFNALYAYSPYHHVHNGTNYPAILFLTGANDPRVDPMQSRKMTARLQASGTSRPVLLRTTSEAGHGIGTPLKEEIEQDVDVFTFLFHELNVHPRPRS